MTERPILFSGPMVKAILDGRKTRTRRVLKPQPEPIGHHLRMCGYYDNKQKGKTATVFANSAGVTETILLPYAVGDVLYVREAFRSGAGVDNLSPAEFPDHTTIFFEADGPNRYAQGRYRPGMHLPKRFARLWLEVTNVRVQRVQSISEADAVAEGIERVGGGRYWLGCTGTDPHGNPQVAFQRLWDSLNAKPMPCYEKDESGKRRIAYYESFPWSGGDLGDAQLVETYRGKPHYITPNPWVAAYTFKRIEKPS